jgi:hypothetical protein
MTCERRARSRANFCSRATGAHDDANTHSLLPDGSPESGSIPSCSAPIRCGECAYPPGLVHQVHVGFRGWNSSSTDCFGSLIRERSLRSFFCASSFCRKRKRGDRVACPDRPCLVMPKSFWPPCVIPSPTKSIRLISAVDKRVLTQPGPKREGECGELDFLVMLARMQGVEVRDAVDAEDDGFAVDHERLLPDLPRCLGDPRVAGGAIVITLQ